MYPAQLQRWPNRTELMMILEASGNRLAPVTHAAAVTRAVGAPAGIAGLLRSEAQGGGSRRCILTLFQRQFNQRHYAEINRR